MMASQEDDAARVQEEVTPCALFCCVPWARPCSSLPIFDGCQADEARRGPPCLTPRDVSVPMPCQPMA